MSSTFGYFFTRNLPENQGLLTRSLPYKSEPFPHPVAQDWLAHATTNENRRSALDSRGLMTTPGSRLRGNGGPLLEAPADGM